MMTDDSVLLYPKSPMTQPSPDGRWFGNALNAGHTIGSIGFLSLLQLIMLIADLVKRVERITTTNNAIIKVNDMKTAVPVTLTLVFQY